MPAQRATVADLDWMLDQLVERREPLVGFAPVFWRPAPDARVRHRAFIEYLLTDGGANAYRTEHALLIAAPRADGWLIDDAYVPGERWSGGSSDGVELWNAFVDDCAGDQVRFVCPTYERERAEFAERVGLTVQESWWLKELTGGGGKAGDTVELPGTHGVTAISVAAPPVYAPPGPVLFVPEIDSRSGDTRAAIAAGLKTADELGCAAMVVNQTAGDDDLAAALTDAGFRRHCDYLTGTVRHV